MRTRQAVAIFTAFLVMAAFGGPYTAEGQGVWSCKVCGENEYTYQCELAPGAGGEGWVYCYAYDNGCFTSDFCGYVV
jgi:hypothetical protein